MSRLTERLSTLAVIAANDEDPTWFCPLIKKTCRKDCVCFVRAGKRRLSADDSGIPAYKVYDPRCGNGMFEGIE